jgi:outer membrane protein assembly factor BamB
MIAIAPRLTKEGIMFRLAMLVGLLGVTLGLSAQVSSTAAISLPGKGLAQHDFFYAGESKSRQMFIVRQGKIVWSYDDPAGKGEISDAVLLSNGNVLFAHQFGVTLITQEKKVLWNYDAPAGHEIHTALPIGKEHVLFIMNGDPAVLRVVNIVTGATEKEFMLKTRQPFNGPHGQFRHARLTANGTLLVAHMDLDKVVEYDVNGAELWSFPASGAWGVSPLENGNVLLTDRIGVREVTRRGDVVWSFQPSETPGYKVDSLQQAWRLPNGNTVINNWVNEWSTTAESRVGTLQLLEVTPSKTVVWALSSWTSPSSLGPATTWQLLDKPAAPEDVHFGEIR